MKSILNATQQQCKSCTTISEKNPNATAMMRQYKKISARQAQEAEQFLNWYPTAQKLMEYFTLARWHDATARETRLVNTPCVTLSQIDSLYNNKGLARTIVGMNFSALYQMGGGRGNFNEAFFYAAVDRFIAKHGNACTMFDLLLYCDAYRDTYKDKFTSNEDFSDYSKQFTEYLKHKALIMEAHMSQPKTETRTSEKEPVGIAGLEVAMIKRVKEGGNLFDSALYRLHLVTKEHAQELMDKYVPQAF